MKKIIISLILCVFMIMSITPAFAADDFFSLEYLEWKGSTGDGCLILEYLSEKIILEDNAEHADIPKGASVQITIKADSGSEISSLSYNGTYLDYERPAVELNLRIDNYSGDNSLEVTYDKVAYNCSVSSVGNGKVTITSPVTNESSVIVPIGERFAYTIEADEGNEIISVTINGEEVDLSRYGKNETNKISKFSMEIPDVREDNSVFVVFSGGQAVKYGDANGDGKVNVTDATTIQKSVAGIITLDAGQLLRGDVDGNKKISVKDATAIQKFVAGIITSFPVEGK